MQAIVAEPYGFCVGFVRAIDLLRKSIYVGRIVHRGEEHAGLHVPILERALWDEIQAMLKRNR